MYGGALLGISSFNRAEMDLRTGEKVVRQIDEATPYNPKAPKAQIMYSGFIGAKYWINPKIGIYSELGLGVSILNAGFSFRI